MQIQRGDIFYADLEPVVGSEQGGIRPVLIIQNDTGNHYSPTIIVASITSKTGKHTLPTHISIPSKLPMLNKQSVVLLEQVRTIDRIRLKGYIGRLDARTMGRVDQAIAVSLGIEGF